MTEPAKQPPVPPDAEPAAGRRRLWIIGGAAALLVLAALAVWAVIAMVNNPTTTQTIRDVFIILMALVGLLVGVALVIVIVQLAVLTNVLRHEIKPILDSTFETARTVRGTTTFISDNLVQPVIKVQASVAAVKRALDALRSNNRG